MTAGAEPAESGVLTHIPGRIRPTAHRGWWIFLGLVVQLAGIGGPAAYVWSKAKHQDVGGLITVATVKLAWHESLHVKAGIEVMAGGAALFAIGSIVLARPFVKHWVTLLIGVPVAALCGALVLGAFALVVALVVMLLLSDGGGADLNWVGGGGGGKKKAKPDEAQAPPDVADQSGGFSA